MNSVVSIETARQERMADQKPTLEQGYCKIVNVVTEALCMAPLTSRQFRVVWAIIRKTYGYNKAKDRIAASQIAELSGLKRQHCSSALASLERMGVIIREGGSFGMVKINTNVEEWEVNSNQHEAPKVDPKNGSLNHDDQNGVTDPKVGSNLDPKMGSHKIQNTLYRKTTSYSSSQSEDLTGGENQKPAKKPDCPYKKIVELYHQILPDLPEVRVLNPKRRSQIKARWQSTVGVNGQRECWNLEFWEKYFNYVRTCPFLMGQSQPSPGRPVFFADLEWLTNATNFAKVIEGKYDPERGGAA